MADAARCAGWTVVAFADDDVSKRDASLLDIPVSAIGIEEAVRVCRQREAQPVVAIGSNAARQRVFDSFRDAMLVPATVIHPAAVLASTVHIGAGTVIFAGVVVNSDTFVGDNAIVNTSATLDHDNRIESHTHVSPGAHLGGTVFVGEGTHIGIGATVKNNVSVGAWSVVGAGAVVVRDLPDRVVAYGTPARVMRRIL